VRKRAQELLSDESALQEILDEGGAKARIVAGETLNRVYDALGLVPGITNQR
jgi:tryptophanyl-tRNA synthetase